MTLDEIKLMSAREAAEVLGVNPHVVYDLWNRGLLDFWLIHKTRKTNLTAIAAFLEKTRNRDLENDANDETMKEGTQNGDHFIPEPQ